MKEIALHILDIAENSVAAGAQTVEIWVEEDEQANRLRVAIQDDGKGMDAQKVAALGDPFLTSRTTRLAGLGIPFLKEAAEACNGSLRVVSSPGQGTRLEAEFEREHIDRMPLGDLAGTLLTLVVGVPETRWVFHYRVNGRAFTFDSAPIRQELGDIPLTEPEILRFVRATIEDGIRGVQTGETLTRPSRNQKV